MGQPVFLVGTPGEVGAQVGELQRPVLRDRLQRFLDRAAATDKMPLLQERAARFQGLLNEVAPHWIEETSATADAAGVPLWQVLALNCLPADFWGHPYHPAPLADAVATEALVNADDAQGIDVAIGGDCTTFFALGDASLPGETLFHKNRDERDEVQCIYIKQLAANFRFIGGGDIGNIGTAHLHTENYWAGANNTGSPVPPEEFQDLALNDCQVLRLLGERCASLDEIVPMLEQLIAANQLGGGAPGHGMILLFADARRGLIVECTSRRLAFRWFEDDVMEVRTNHFLLPEMEPYALQPNAGSVHRLERARELWYAQHGFASIPLCAEIGRDRQGAPLAICRNPSDGLGSVTVATSTATISSRDDARCQTHFRNCHPSYVPGIILTPLDRVSDTDLVGGAHNQEWRNYRGFV